MAQNLKVGDRVRITRTAKTRERGWQNSWQSDPMDKAVGKIGTVVHVGDGFRYDVVVEISGFRDNWGFPSFVLELVPKKKRRTK